MVAVEVPLPRSLALVAVLVLLPAAAQAGKRGDPLLAVWDVASGDAERAEAWHWYGEVVAAAGEVEGLRVDSGAVFRPSVRPAEGRVVAVASAERWLEAAWTAWRAGEPAVATELARDALRQVEAFPATRLPDGLLRELHVMEARGLVAQGRDDAGRAALRAALLVDPSWVPADRWEPAHFVAAALAMRAEQELTEHAALVVSAGEPGAGVLLHGVEQGRTGADGTLSLNLPPGLYDVAVRKPGFADAITSIQLRPGRELAVELQLEVRNSPGFQEALLSALANPGDQRGAPVWAGLEQAARQLDARGILVARFAGAGDGAVLQVGLYLPGRGGWALWREAPIAHDLARDEQVVDALAADLIERLLREVQGEVLAAR